MMIDSDSRELSISVQADLLGINRTSLYYHPTPPSEWDLQLNRHIDMIYTEHSEFGYRRVAVWLKKYHDISVNQKDENKSKSKHRNIKKWPYLYFG